MGGWLWALSRKRRGRVGGRERRRQPFPWLSALWRGALAKRFALPARRAGSERTPDTDSDTGGRPGKMGCEP